MKDSIRVAVAIAAGYYLGRRHKLRLAAALVAAGAAGRLRRGEGGGLVGKALKNVGASPELEQVFGRLRGDLTEVGKAAAVAATGRQIDSISTKLHDRAESLRTPGKAGADDEEEPGDQEEPRDEEEREEEEQEEEASKAKREPITAGKGRG